MVKNQNSIIHIKAVARVFHFLKINSIQQFSQPPPSSQPFTLLSYLFYNMKLIHSPMTKPPRCIFEDTDFVYSLHQFSSHSFSTLPSCLMTNNCLAQRIRTIREVET